MKVLHVVPHARHSGIARELDMLLTAPTFALDEVSVCCLGGDGPAVTQWRDAGAQVILLNWRRWLNPRPLWDLAAHIRCGQPDTIYAWGLESLRAIRLAAPQLSGQLIVRKPLSRLGRRHPRSAAFSRLDCWLLKSANRLLAASSAEFKQCVASGIPDSKVRIVPTAVSSPPSMLARNCDSTKPQHLLCAGAMKPEKGFYDAIWAFDFFGYLYDDIRLTIIGEGPERPRLESFARGTGRGPQIQWLGAVPDLGPWLSRATVMWMPSLVDTGAGVTLEAMAAGLPVVAYRWPSLEELMIDGETGFLVEPGNKMQLAQRTRQLLDDAELRHRFGLAARRRAEQQYSPIMFVNSWRQACQECSSTQEAANRA
jgi:glycosyltransferase involved in cell wall biosynthesis